MTLLSYTYWHPTEIQGHVVRLPSHRAVQWLRDPTYEQERVRTMIEVIQPDHVVFDVGTEQGDMSALWSQLTPHGGVVLIEPNPKVWPCVFETFKENNLADPIASWPGFCGAERNPEWGVQRGWPEMDFEAIIDPAAGFFELNKDEAVTTTVDWLAENTAPPNIITIDVEGAEVAVLTGAWDTLRSHRPEVFVSIHPTFLKEYDAMPGDVFRLLRNADYECQVLAADHEIHLWATPL